MAEKECHYEQVRISEVSKSIATMMKDKKA
jgi:hypothetical protein